MASSCHRLNPRGVKATRTDGVNAASTISVALATLLCHARTMNRPVPVAGGFFLVLPIIIGFLWGVPAGRSMQGALAGLGIGLALALAIWLIDRRRRSR